MKIIIRKGQYYAVESVVSLFTVRAVANEQWAVAVAHMSERFVQRRDGVNIQQIMRSDAGNQINQCKLGENRVCVTMALAISSIFNFKRLNWRGHAETRKTKALKSISETD